MFTTWRLLRGNSKPDSVIRCLLYFAEVPPLGKLAIPFAFMPTEMIQYEVRRIISKIKKNDGSALPNVHKKYDIEKNIYGILPNTYLKLHKLKNCYENKRN